MEGSCLHCFEGQRGPTEAVHPCPKGERLTGKKKRGKIKWSEVVNFELNKALWILSSVQMQVSQDVGLPCFLM